MQRRQVLGGVEVLDFTTLLEIFGCCPPEVDRVSERAREGEDGLSDSDSTGKKWLSLTSFP
jgi:hypothetical protein